MGAQGQKTILLVEDDILSAKVLGKTLSSFGYQVITAHSGQRAVEIALANEVFDMVLTDIDLGPGLDGTAAATQILKTRSIPIVFLTSHGEKEIAEKVHGTKRYGYIIKNSGDFVLQSSIEMAFELFEATERLKRELDEHKRTEKSRRSSEERYRAVAQSAHDAIITIDTRGIVFNWNKGAEQIFGYEETEIAGRSLTMIIPSDYLEAHLSGMDRVTRGGEHHVLGRTVELHGLHKSGRVFPVELSLAMWETSEGIFYTGIIRDITQRKIAEEELKTSLRQKNILLKEVHHRVGNNLQVISSLLNIQAVALKDGTARDVLKESQQRIHSMSLVHESLYRSDDLSHIPLGDYLQDLAKSIVKQFGRPEIRTSFDVEPIFLQVDTAIPCGLIANELMTNCMKHAFPSGAEGSVRISLRRASRDALALTVHDDGVGFPGAKDFLQMNSTGLSLVMSLAQQISGSVRHEEGPGTTFVLTFPG